MIAADAPNPATKRIPLNAKDTPNEKEQIREKMPILQNLIIKDDRFCLFIIYLFKV